MWGRTSTVQFREAGSEPRDRIVVLRRGDPRIPRFSRTEVPADLPTRFQWAMWIPTVIALADDALPAGVVGYVVRTAGVDVATVVLSRVGLEPGNYESLHLVAAGEVAHNPIPDHAALTTVQGNLLDEVVTLRRDDGASTWLRRPPDSFLSPQARSWRNTVVRARLYKRFEGAPRSTVLGMSVRTREWRRIPAPTTFRS